TVTFLMWSRKYAAPGDERTQAFSMYREPDTGSTFPTIENVSPDIAGSIDAIVYKPSPPRSGWPGVRARRMPGLRIRFTDPFTHTGVNEASSAVCCCWYTSAHVAAVDDSRTSSAAAPSHAGYMPSSSGSGATSGSSSNGCDERGHRVTQSFAASANLSTIGARRNDHGVCPEG